MRSFRREVEALKEGERDASMTPRETEEVLTGILDDVSGHRRSSFPRPLAWSAAVAAVFVGAVWYVGGEPVPSMNGYVLASNAPCAERGRDGGVSTATCPEEIELSSVEASIRLAPKSEVRMHSAHRVRVLRGRARFKVNERNARVEPYRVDTSHGVIRVVGTEFEVEQTKSRGLVRVFSGSVEFTPTESTLSERVNEGGVLRWPLERGEDTAVEEPVPGSEEPAPTLHELGTSLSKKRARRRRLRRAQGEPEDSHEQERERVVQRLVQLRAQRRFAEAIELMRRAAAQAELPREFRAEFSMELGRLLEKDAPKEACKHWEAHLRKFESLPGDSWVRARLKRCSHADSF